MAFVIDTGTAEIRGPDTLVAGTFATLEYVYTAGHPVDDSGYIRIAFRSMGDFGRPQFDEPKQPNHCTVRTSGNCRIEPRWDPKGNTRPWGRTLYLRITGGYLDRGETVTVVFGDTSQGAPGWQIQTFCEHTFEFKTMVDPIATYRFKELPCSPTVRIVAGTPVRAVLIAPSLVVAGKRFAYWLKLEDRWGNPVRKPQRRSHPGFAEPGLQRIAGHDDDTGLAASSNPIEVVAQVPERQPYWADFHGQSEETIGSNSIEDYMTFAKVFACLDIAGHQGNDFQITDGFWQKVNALARRFYKPGKFVTFPGYEWSGNTPLGGDRNVYFASEGGHIVHSCTDLLPGDSADSLVAPTARELFARLKQQDGPDAFAFAHVGGRYADLRMHDADIELAVEVHSAWGTFDWLVEEALDRGYRIGICANSDGHKGRPGASYPGAAEFGSLGGLTCVLARSLTREDVLAALRARHFYATTGHRPLVDLLIETGDGHQASMGDVIERSGKVPVLHARLVGTAPIERVEVRRGSKTIKTLRPFSESDLGNRIKIEWSGAEVRGRARETCWDGCLTLAKGNRIVDVEPVNFWNPLSPLVHENERRVSWRSITTGGTAGMILSLRDAAQGELHVRTAQRLVTFPVRDVGLEGRKWTCGGLRKQIEVRRLPPPGRPNSFSFTLPLRGLRGPEAAVYLRIEQEDGHVAWTSPVYIQSAD